MNPFHEFGTYPKGYENKKICELQYCNYYFQECIGLDKQSLGHVLMVAVTHRPRASESEGTKVGT